MFKTGLLTAAALVEYMLARGHNALAQSVVDRIENERMWVPLSKEYSNLMGVTDEDIQKFKTAVTDDFIGRFIKRMINRGLDIDSFPSDFFTGSQAESQLSLLWEGMGDYDLADFRKYKDVIDKDYLKYVRVLTRAQIFDIAVNLGNKLKKQLGVDTLTKNYTDTIYITSPRGGLEFLSIFAYANLISKEAIPSDLNKKTGVGDIWLGNETAKIRTVVIVDDIIASGSQIADMVTAVKSKLPWVKNIIPVYIAMREWPWAVWTPKKKYFHLKNDVSLKDIYDSVIYEYKTIGIKKWRKKKNPVPNKDIITVGFPWSLPDGSSDEYLHELYGSRSRRGRRR